MRLNSLKKYNRGASIKIMALKLLLSILVLTAPSCENYLDIVPDNVATLDNAFTLRSEAEKFLFTCYSYLPKDGDPRNNIAFLSGDELWIPSSQRDFATNAVRIAKGEQNVSNPLMNMWDTGLFIGIRNCNIFIENLSDLNKVPDITQDERTRWIGEAEFLKAYYHYYLLRMYGPIPIVDKDIPVSASEDQVRVKRKPIDETVDYIAALLDKAAEKLPPKINDRVTEAGRITKPIALSVKAELLLMAASPLFNGNTDFSDFKDKDGTSLFNPVFDANKWVRAAEASKAAIAACEAGGHQLYSFSAGSFKLSDTTKIQMSIRNAVTDRFNTEQVWADPNSQTTFLQRAAMAVVVSNYQGTEARAQLAAPIKIAEQFYTKNGVPINEDKDWAYTNRYNTRVATRAERFNISEGYETAGLNFDRENRFYANLSFDGGIWYKFDSPTNSDEGTFVLRAKLGQYGGANSNGFINETGYFIKKLVDWNMSFGTSTTSYRSYPWPRIRLASVYLMYAEAMNEAYGPSDEVYNYLNLVRARAGLKTVQESWTNFSSNPTKYTTKDGLRDIIQQERLIELAFEGSRYWDLRRWKKSLQEQNKPILAWSVNQSATNDYYQLRTLFQQRFVGPRDYFWPIMESNLRVNPNLVQNPGW